MAFNIYLQEQPFSRSILRVIDEATIIDLLSIIEHEAERTRLLEEAGYLDQIGVHDVLYDYVLDALGVPPDQSALPSGDTFSRSGLEEMFYAGYLQHSEWDDVATFLDALKREVNTLKVE